MRSEAGFDDLLDRLARIARGEAPASSAEIEAEVDPQEQELLVALVILHEDLRAQAEARQELVEARRMQAAAEQGSRDATERADALTSALGELAEANRDLRRAKEALDTRTRMEVMGEVAGGVAHDFNNMLMGLMGLIAEMQEAVADDESVAARVEELSETVLRSRRISSRMLEFGRRAADAREPGAPAGRVDVGAVVRQSRRLLAHTLGPEIQLRVRCAEQVSEVEIDAADIERVLFNLVVNARDAIDSTGSVTIEGGPREGLYVLAVRDTGAGMAPEVLERAFEPFFTTKPAGVGTGVGLASTRAIAEAAGGSVCVETEAGKGTTMTIELPLVRGGEA